MQTLRTNLSTSSITMILDTQILDKVILQHALPGWTVQHKYRGWKRRAPPAAPPARRPQAPCKPSSAQCPNCDGLRAEHQGRDVAATLILSTGEVGW